MQLYVDIDNIVSSSFEDNFIQISFVGCNFKCPHCNVSNYYESKSEFLVNIKDVKSKIEDSFCTGVVFTGGEPLLQRQALINLLKFCKSKGLKTCINTNGSKPSVLKSLLSKNLLDFVLFDLKSLGDNFSLITRCETFFINSKSVFTDINESLNLLKLYENEIDIVFKTLVIPGRMYRKDQFLKLGEFIRNYRARWIISPFSKSGVSNLSFKEIHSPSFEYMVILVDYLKKSLIGLNIELVLN